MSGWTIVWIVLLSLLGLLVLLLAVPIYLRVTFHGELTVLVRVLGIPFRLYPRKKKPEKEKPPKAEKPNSYKAQKERQSILNRAAGAVRRAEERIAAAEQELEDINQKLASPVIASDYVKSAELAKEADSKQAEIDALYSQWEQAQQALDELCEESSKPG